MAYDNNINPGNPPLVWSRMRDAFDRVNENFTIIAASVGRRVPKDIETVTLGNPVIITTEEDHQLSSRDRVTVVQTEISQLDGNTYYVKITRPDTIELYTDENLTIPVNGTAYDAWTSPNAGQIQALNDFTEIDFENLTQNLSPNSPAVYQLGSSTKPWKNLHVGEYATDDERLYNGVWLGTAQIKGITGTVDLPFGSTIDGNLIIDPEKRYFRYININDGDTIEADGTNDTVSFYTGNGLQLVGGSAADSITFNNTGVLSNVAGLGISVSSSTGDVTVTNTGVRSLQNVTALPSGRTEGAGININGSTGDNLKITNTGVLEVQTGSAALTVFTDTATGIVTITNAAPAGNSFRFVEVNGAVTIEANSVAGTLKIVQGNGITLTGDAGTDTVNVAFSGVADITGSVFADDSTKMVDAIENEMYASGGFFGNLTGNVTGNVLGNVTGNLTGNVLGNVTGDTTGYHTGDMTGSVFADDSTKLVDAVEGKIVGTVDADILRTSPLVITGSTINLASTATTTISSATTLGIQGVGTTTITSTGGSIDITANSEVDISGSVVNVATGMTVSGGITGDLTGSVFADDSTLLVDGVGGVLRGTHVGDLIGSVFADNSTMIVNGVDGSLAYYPTTPGDWDGDAPTTVGEALDRLATVVKALNGGTGA